jgi:hypothetical protein
MECGDRGCGCVKPVVKLRALADSCLAGLARRESFTIGDISCRALVSIQLPSTETPQSSLLCHARKGDKPLPRRITWSFVIVDHAFQVRCGFLAPLDDVGEL